MKLFPSLVLLSGALAGAMVTAPGCAPRGGPSGLVTLDASLHSLRERFNAEKDRPRVIALLSPT